MNSNEIESNVKRIFENFSKEEFPFDLLLAYGISKTSITRLKKGDFNLSKTKGEILYKKKIFFKEEATGSLLSCVDSIAKDESIIKHKPRFAIVTDFKTLVAKDLKRISHPVILLFKASVLHRIRNDGTRLCCIYCYST